MTKTVKQHTRDWSDKLLEALWPYRTTWKNTRGYSPYEMVYDKQVLLPIEFQISRYRLVVELDMDLNETQQQRVMKLNELDEVRHDPLQQTTMVQQQRIKWHDKFIKKKEFQVGDWALLFDSKFKYFKGKLTTHWLGPYEIQEVFGNGSVKIKTIDEEEVSFLVNGHRLKV